MHARCVVSIRVRSIPTLHRRVRRSAKRSRHRAQLAFEARLSVSMTFASACVNSFLGFPASLHWLRAGVPSFRLADEGANRPRAAAAFRRTAQRRVDFADAPGTLQRRYGRPNLDVRQHVTGTNDHAYSRAMAARIEDFYPPS